MDNEEREPFNQSKYINDWLQKNYTCVSAKYPSEYVARFKKACKKLGISQSKVFKDAMQNVIDEAESK